MIITLNMTLFIYYANDIEKFQILSRIFTKGLLNQLLYIYFFI